MFVVTFTQVILVHWSVISIACKMTCEQPVNNTIMDKQHASMVHMTDMSVNKLYCIYDNTFRQVF